ncbi:unnamed protein product [Ranitomeya imitator]|uniref:LRRCT domain-containing protein n=1 Tax=Ranitomeya imitator TaxID=111125 RepID=A0ABN9LS78_9NEOB|nr:unnamed protein product [Ranitomeya imitator]
MAKTNSQGFQYISQKFSSISPAKLKKGVFVGPHIREFMRDEVFEGTLNDKELRSWKSFKWICENKKSPEYVEGGSFRSQGWMSAGPVMTSRSHDRDVMEGPCRIASLALVPAARMERSPERLEERERRRRLTLNRSQKYKAGQNKLDFTEIQRGLSEPDHWPKGKKYNDERDLKNNLISKMEPGAFLGLPELKRLDISNNRIGCVLPAAFQGLSSLSRLFLSGNIFSTLGPGVFDELPSLKLVDFSTDFLTCDCHLQWIATWAKNGSAKISDRTLCSYPSALRERPLRNLKESQLTCGGTPELHTHHLIPSLRQVVFQGDRIPIQCTASYVGNASHIIWYHNGRQVLDDEEQGIILEETIIHDCTFITRTSRTFNKR